MLRLPKLPLLKPSLAIFCAAVSTCCCRERTSHCNAGCPVIVGADRIAANGDTANKIGTYTVAVLAKEHGIPFYVAAPLSTVDFSLRDGSLIPIEQRKEEEIRYFNGRQTVPDTAMVFNPAFDVTPERYITAIITEKGVAYPPLCTIALQSGRA